MSSATIEDVVARVDRWHGLDVSVSTLSGGLTNANFLVTTETDEKFVVRIPGADTELLAIDRSNERFNAEAAATTGVSPHVVDYLSDLNVMVLEFIEGRTMSGEALRSHEQVGRISTSLRRLHGGPRFLHDFDMFRIVEFYLQIAARHEVRIPEGYREHMGTVGQVERALGVNTVASVPCHNDLLAENYIDDGRQLWIVDFEYSGNGDPCFELGDTAQECAFDDELRAVLCEAYFGRSDPIQLARMELFALMSDMGWTLWAAIQAKISAIDYDFWGWAEERWSRAVALMEGPTFDGLLRRAAGG